MKLIDIHVEHFGKLTQADFHFDEHLTVLYGKNEAGKSTLHAFLKALFFGQERKRGRAAKTDEYSRFLPWEQSGEYGGSLRFESGGRNYLLHRTFLQQNRQLELLDETGRSALPGSQETLKPLIGNLTPDLYDNTISIGQLKSATGQSLADALKNHAGSLQKTGSSQIRLEAATASIRQQKKKLEQALHPVTEKDRDALQAQIRQAEALAPEGPAYEDADLSEQTREALLKNLASQTEEYRRLEQLVKRSKDFLEASPLSGEEETRTLRRRLQNAWNTRKSHRSFNDSSPFCRYAAFFSEACYYGMLLLFLAAELFLFRKVYLPCILLSVGAAGAYLASCWFSVNQKNYQVLCQAEAFLKEAFSLHLKRTELTQWNYDTLCQQLDAAALLFERTSRMEAKLSHLADSIFRTQEALSHKEEQARTLQRSLWEAEAAQEKRNALYASLEELEEKLAENSRLQEDIAACTRALEVLEEISLKLRETFGGPLHETASRILSGLTGGRYQSLSYDQNGELFLTEGSRRIFLDQLSRGTVDQVYLALRLSALQIFWPQCDMPLIFDDSFALYDEERLRNTLTYLGTEYPGQVLIFTCHDREARLCRELSLPATLLSL